MSIPKTNVMRILENAGISFLAYTYNPAKGIDAKSVANQINKIETQVFKTLVTQSPTKNHSFEYFVFVIASNMELDLKKAASAAQVKNLEMLPMKNLLPLTGYIHGGCSPIGMKKTLKTFIDETAMTQDKICVSGGKVGFTIELSSNQLASFINAPFADLTKKG
ncbi:MAG: Cys-tRNA(Pro) deacylase [Alphaproteobacteria bacterium]|nr:Cys-tRNA(Pro) deacylase [Alphaproteobacteria bacterium]